MKLPHKTLRHAPATDPRPHRQYIIDALAPPEPKIATLIDLLFVAVLAFGTGVLVMDLSTAHQIERWTKRGGDLAIAGYTIVCELPLTIDCQARHIGPNEVRP